MVIVTMVVIFIPIAVIHSILMDSLIRIQYDLYRETWIESGKPGGMLFKPPGSSFIASQKLYFNIFHNRYNSDWLVNDPQALKIFKRLNFAIDLMKIYLALFFPVLIFLKIVL